MRYRRLVTLLKLIAAATFRAADAGNHDRADMLDARFNQVLDAADAARPDNPDCTGVTRADPRDCGGSGDGACPSCAAYYTLA